jgi:hypothetical protein
MTKQLLGIFALSCLMGVVTQSRADITLVFDSGWLEGCHNTRISNDTVSGALTSIEFDLDFDMTDLAQSSQVGDGDTDIDDMLLVIAAWGPC